MLLSAALIFAACGNKNTTNNTTATVKTNTVVLNDAQYKNANLQIGLAQKRTLSAVLKLTGTIDVPPQNMVSVSAPLGGYLKSTRLLPGMPVNRGEIIASMEDPQYIQLQQDYLTGNARLTMLNAEYERQKELNKSKAGSDKILQQTESEYKIQRIAQKAIEEKLRLIGINPEGLNENNISRSISIYSPISGFVSKVNVNIGKFVNPTDVLFELVNPADIHLNLKVYEKDLDLVHIGQKVKAWTNSNPAKKYDCEVILIGKDIGSERNVEMHCHFNQYDKILVPGMFMNAEAEVKSEWDLTVPDAAIIHYEEKDYCFVNTAGKSFELVEIKKGISQNGFTAISALGTQDLSHMQLVLEGSHTLWMVLKNGDE